MFRKQLAALVPTGILAFALVASACFADARGAPAGQATATPTATGQEPGEGTATPTGSGAFNDCPDSRSLCIFATYLNLKFEAEDFTAVVREATPREVICKADYADGYDPDAPLCRGKPAGTRVLAYDAGRTYSEGYRTTAEGLETLLRNYAAGADATVADDYGAGAFRMYSIGKGDCADCRGHRVLVFSRIQELEPTPAAGPRYIRDALMLYVSAQGTSPETWKIDYVLTGLQLGSDIPTRLGGASQPDGTRFSVWNPSDGAARPGNGPIWLGASVVVSAGGDCLNLRQDPSGTAPIVTCLSDGGRLVVAGPARQADGLIWWPVQSVGGPDGPSRAGWASGEFLAPVVS